MGEIRILIYVISLFKFFFFLVTEGSYSNSTLVPSKIDVNEIINNLKNRKSAGNIISGLKKYNTTQGNVGGSFASSTFENKKSFLEKTKNSDFDFGLDKKQLTMMNFAKRGKIFLLLINIFREEKKTFLFLNSRNNSE